MLTPLLLAFAWGISPLNGEINKVLRFMQINFLGFGNMGQAMAKALITNKYRAKVIASDRKKTVMPGVAFDSDFRTISAANIIVIAVKPQDVPSLADGVRGRIPSSAILVSIAAGLPVAKISKLFRHKKVVRIMPNLGLAVGQGFATWKSSDLSASDKKTAQQFLNNVTENFEVKNESMIDAGTLIYGCGPAYFFLLASLLEREAVKLGISPAHSRKMVEKTFMAAATLQKNNDYQTLISRVASKKGVTEAGLKIFQKKNFQKIISEVISASLKRTKELSK